MNGLSKRMRGAAKGALFALQPPARDAFGHIDSSELRGVVIRWPAVLEWTPAKIWVEPLFRGLSARMQVIVDDIPQRLKGTVVVEFCRGDRVHRVSLNYSDDPDLVHLGKDDRSSSPLALEFKMQFRNGGYGNDSILPGGFVPGASAFGSACIGWYARRARQLRDRRQFDYDVYGRFGLGFATEIRTRALQTLQNQSRVHFYGGATKVNFREFLREIAGARVCLDLPGNGPFCFRLVNYLAVGACVISPPHGVSMPVPLVDRTHIVYTRPDMSDVLDLCEQYVNDEAAREAVVSASRDYYRRNLYWRSLSDYYLRTMLDRLPPATAAASARDRSPVYRAGHSPAVDAGPGWQGPPIAPLHAPHDLKGGIALKN